MAMQYSELHEENKALCETGLKTRIERLLHLLGKSKQCWGTRIQNLANASARNPERTDSFRYLSVFTRKDCPIFQEHSPLAGIDTFAGKPRNRGVIAEKDFNHVPRRILMIRKIVLLASAGVLAASVATAQTTPPPGNVNPGSMNSGAEQSGAENQPRSTGGQRGGTTGSGMTAPSPKAGGSTQDGINANVKPSSKESGSEPAGEPAGQRR